MLLLACSAHFSNERWRAGPPSHCWPYDGRQAPVIGVQQLPYMALAETDLAPAGRRKATSLDVAAKGARCILLADMRLEIDVADMVAAEQVEQVMITSVRI